MSQRRCAETSRKIDKGLLVAIRDGRTLGVLPNDGVMTVAGLLATSFAACGQRWALAERQALHELGRHRPRYGTRLPGRAHGLV